jgi:serralysin
LNGQIFADAGLLALASSASFGAAAHDADDRIIYDQATGTLNYDRDGNGAGSHQFAMLSPGLSLNHTNIRYSEVRVV